MGRGDRHEDVRGRHAGADGDLWALSRELIGLLDDVLDDPTRAQLVDLVVSTITDQTLEGVLGRIATAAGALTRARYAAVALHELGSGRASRTFVHRGVGARTAAQVGDQPVGHGLLGVLGVLADGAVPVRLREIADHPASYGFPVGHPTMRSFLGAPITVGDRAVGSLYVAEKDLGAGFTDADQDVVLRLAAAVGDVVRDARRREQADTRRRWTTATAEITVHLNTIVAGDDPLELVADLAREVSGADMAWVVARRDLGSLELRVVSGATTDAGAARALALEQSLAAQVMATGRIAAASDLSTDPRAIDPSAALGWPRLGPALFLPLVSRGAVDGVLALAWTPERADGFAALDPDLPSAFAEQAALAIQVAHARVAHQRLERLEDRERIARDLHDLVVQRLFAVAMGLENVQRGVDQPEVAAVLSRAVDDLDTTVRDIRRTIFALGVTDDETEDVDVQTLVERVVDRAAAVLTFRPHLTIAGPLRTTTEGPVVPDLLAVLNEALTNVARHAGASSVDVTITVTNELVVRVADDGRGMPGPVRESGLANLRTRATGRRGTFVVAAAPGGGTAVTWSVPLTPAPDRPGSADPA